jgi:hypothetical protein
LEGWVAAGWLTAQSKRPVNSGISSAVGQWLDCESDLAIDLGNINANSALKICVLTASGNIIHFLKT